MCSYSWLVWCKVICSCTCVPLIGIENGCCFACLPRWCAWCVVCAGKALLAHLLTPPPPNKVSGKRAPGCARTLARSQSLPAHFQAGDCAATSMHPSHGCFASRRRLAAPRLIDPPNLRCVSATQSGHPCGPCSHVP